MNQQADSENKFQGFIPPTRNYFPMPNMWIDICAEINNLSELKVVQYVLRHTWGYKEYDGTPKTITTDEFMSGRKYTQGERRGQRIDKGTGLSNKSVIEGLKKAVEHGYLVCTVDDSDKGRIVKAYALNMANPNSGLDMEDLHSDVKDLNTSYEEPSYPYEESTHLTGVKNLHSSYEESTQVPMKKVHSRREESSQRTEKDKEEKHLRKTPKKERTAAPTSSHSSDDSFTQSSSFLEQKENASRLRIAPRIDETPPAMPSVPVSPPQGYKTDDSGDEVQPDSTEPPSRASQISAWLDDLKIFSDKSKRDGYIATLEASSRIDGKKALVSLRDYASDELLRVHGVRKRVFLGNMVGCLEDWVASQSPGQASPSSPPEAGNNDLAPLEDEIRQSHPKLIMARRSCIEFGAYLAIWYSERDEDYIMIRDRKDWEAIQGDTWEMKYAKAYGEARWQQLQKAM